MSEGEKRCKLFGGCANFTTADKCNTSCDFYNPKNPDEVLEIPKEVVEEKKSDVTMAPSDLPKFDKFHEFFVIKRHVFIMQSVSPKKIILKYKRKLKKSDNLADGCYIFRNQNNELLDPSKVFTKFDRTAKSKQREADAKS